MSPCSRETFSAFFPLSHSSSGASPPGFCNILCGPNHIAHAYYILICLYVYYCILHAYLSVFISIGMSKGTKWVSVFFEWKKKRLNKRERKNTVFILWNHIIIRTFDYSELNWWINAFSQQLREACIWCGLKADNSSSVSMNLCSNFKTRVGIYHI